MAWLQDRHTPTSTFAFAALAEGGIIEPHRPSGWCGFLCSSVTDSQEAQRFGVQIYTEVKTVKLATLMFFALMAHSSGSVVQHGGVTFYYNQFEGRNLKCPGYKYEEATGPWLAVDIGLYESGATQCGDWYLIIFSDGSTMRARALDSGRLADASVWDTGLPFIADLPRYWRNGRVTATGTIINLSAVGRFRKNLSAERGVHARWKGDTNANR